MCSQSLWRKDISLKSCAILSHCSMWQHSKAARFQGRCLFLVPHLRLHTHPYFNFMLNELLHKNIRNMYNNMMNRSIRLIRLSITIYLGQKRLQPANGCTKNQYVHTCTCIILHTVYAFPACSLHLMPTCSTAARHWL